MVDWDWFKSKKNLTLLGTWIGAIVALIWIVSQLYERRKRSLKTPNDEMTLMKLEKQEKEIATIKRGLRNLELSQCSSAHVEGNAELQGLLQCPLPRTPAVQPIQQQQQQQQQQMPMTPMGDLVTPTGGLATFDAQMPNYGFFGPFGTSGTQAGGMMPAFQQ